MAGDDQHEAKVTPEAEAQNAREIIEAVAAENGVFSPEFKQRAEQGDKDMRTLMKSNERLKAKLSNAVKNLSENLYKSQSRFVLECIQNADDNKYDHGQSPFLRFIVNCDYIRIVSNEDGFEEADIRAISSVGESTKAGEAAKASKRDPTTCIGEKGIGFKSVFKIASQAHIRSPPYIFMFDKDRELGMITPLWDEVFFSTRESSPDVKTEIILMAPPREGPVKDYAKDLRRDFMILRPTCLMFLRRLKHLQITIHSKSNQAASDRSFSLVGFKGKRMQIREVENAIGSREIISDYYRHQFDCGSPPVEAKRPNVKETSFTLAFPIKLVEKDWEPLEEQQSVFAFLPIHDFGFKFVIHADFLTTSDREGIEEDNAWNIHIRNGIAQGFAIAIEDFLKKFGKDAAICYTWLRYLSRNSGPKTNFWRELDNRILKSLKSTDVILSRTGSLLKPEFSTLMEWAHDRDGVPLFGPESGYVSQRYQIADQAYLHMLGVRTPSSQWLLDELKKLDRNEGLRSKSMAWHEDIAKVIDDNLQSQHDWQLRQLLLIPLEDGDWVRSSTLEEDAIFFAESIGTNIPIDINFRLVEKRASQSADRRKLFARLGVKVCKMQDVVDQIAAKHSKAMKGASLSWTPATLVSHAIYLYHASGHAIKLTLPAKEQFVYLANDAGVAMPGRSLYLDRSKIPDILFRDPTRGQSCHFLHPLYLESLLPEKRPPFVSWLEEVACLATILRLQRQSDKELHPDFKFFMESRPDEVLATLKANWSHYSHKLSPSIRTALQNHKVLCSASGAISRVALNETFVPVEQLVQLSRELAEGDCPFLQLPFGQPADWSFLKIFEVGFEKGLKFYTWILFQDAFRTHCSIKRAKRLFTLIQDQCRDINTSQIRLLFKYNLILVVPNGEDDDADAWCRSDKAVWSAPQGFMGPKISLKPLYGQGLEPFFCTMLGIQNASVQEVLLDLEERKKSGFSSVQDVTHVYEYLQALCINSASNAQYCRHYFKSSALILVSDDNGCLSWKKLSDCVWSNDAFRRTSLKLKSKAALSAEYSKHLVYFFTNVLEIRDAGLEEFLADLQLLRTNESTDEATVLILYQLIQSSAPGSEELVRTSFNNFDSVLIPNAVSISASDLKIARWYPLSGCVWSAPKYLEGKIVLSNHYPYLQELFCRTLNVPNATPSMLVDELLQVTRSEPSSNATNHCKALILGLTTYLKSGIAIDGASLTLLQNEKCWPCRKSGCPSFEALSEAYANDRQKFWEVFSKRVYMLDFSFEQVQTLKVLLTQLKFGNYLSEHVRVETCLSQIGDIDEESTSDLRARAYALYTCACEYSKGKATQDRPALRSLLHGISVYQSSSIITTYSLDDLKESKDSGGLHIELADALTLYVSTDPAKRKYALHTLLPTEMITKVLKIPLQSSYQVISSVLQLDLNMLDWILVDQGIISGQPESDAGVSTESSNYLTISSHLQITKSRFNSISMTRGKNENLQKLQQQGYQDLETSDTSLSSDQSRANTPLSLPATTETQPSSISSTPGKDLRRKVSLSGSTEFANSGDLRDIEQLLTPKASSTINDSPQFTRSPRQLPDRSQIPFLAENKIKKWTANFKEGAEGSDVTGFQVESVVESALLLPDTFSSSIRQGPFDMSSLSFSLPAKINEEGTSATQEERTHSSHSFFSSTRNDTQRARHFGLGFLGELFTVTKLKEEYKLPNFTEQGNWTSSLREYAGFSKTKDDVSDIIYDDTDGAFTRCLMQQYHQSLNQPPKWLQTSINSGSWPKYFLEVKTTTESLGTPFFISNAQFHNAKKRTFKENTAMQEVYVIVRVFHFPISEDCDAKGARICMYLDPYALWQDGTLRLEAKDGYAVFPGT